MTATWPKCATARQERDGAYFVCVACRWRWTVSITGQVYVQERWAPSGDVGGPATSAPASDTSPNSSQESDLSLAHRLLWSVEGLASTLADFGLAREDQRVEAGNTAKADLPPRILERLRIVRAATEGGYFNEGVPLDRLRDEGLPLILPPEADA